MNVKSLYNQFKIQKIRLLCLSVSLVFLILGVSIFELPNRELREKKSELELRSIGHKLLLKIGDSESVVPPIQQLNTETLKLQLPKETSIDPDHLVELSLNHLNSELAVSYIVNVFDLKSNEMVYGFEINHLDQPEISCLGRVLPSSDYEIEFSFYHQNLIPLTSNLSAFSFAGASLLLVLFGLSAPQKRNRPNVSSTVESNDFHIDIDLNRLHYNDRIIELTTKETKILAILFKRTGSLVERDYLLNEVWLKEGTMTTRSLDMYISRLRKKLEVFPQLAIVNQRGKGYYLQLD